MDIVVALIVIAVAFASGCLYSARKKNAKEEKHEPYTRAESAKEAYYTRNFWNYDGGEQEDYQG